MSYLTPREFTNVMIDVGEAKINMSPRDMILRGAMAGAILGIAVALAVTAAVQTGLPIVGAVIFPVGFCTLNLLGLDLVTGVFGLAPLPLIAGRKGITLNGMLKSWGYAFLGNLIGSVAVAFLLAIAWTQAFTDVPPAAGLAIAKAADARTLGYEAHGAAGMLTVFVKGILCNWMVVTGVIGAMLSKSVGGKVIAMWMPILIFFGLGFEHAVVNMYLFPLGMMMGGELTVWDWLVWNEIPVTLGNIVGGLVFTAGALYVTHGPGNSRAVVESVKAEHNDTATTSP
ncbi:formate/nitrite transporter family protein [Salinisphaera aquimarina]|uniref:Formate/nitrite transporter family protein n=1 Tax=Salinisphaera aquimarina TaxID=2094031 RepID=A0ABV7ELX7_9GAMM